MSRTGRVIHTGRTVTIGGREDGTSRSSDGLLDIRFSAPGSARIGTNPEQLLAAAWSASFASSVAAEAQTQGVPLPAGVNIGAEVVLNLGDDGYFFSIRFDIRMPGLAPGAARDLIDRAQKVCPFAQAMRGNVRLSVNLL